MSKKNEQYSLFTAISMIVGICIGSGIFFKADDVLRATGGNVTLGVIIFVMEPWGLLLVVSVFQNWQAFQAHREA